MTAAFGRSSLLNVKDLQAVLPTRHGPLKVVDQVSFSLHRGRTLGLVGGSGSGKSMLAKAIMGLLPLDALVSPNSVVEFKGRNLLNLTAKQKRRIIGHEIAMVFQDPMTSLNPVMKIGKQISEVLRCHLKVSRAMAGKRAVELLDSVGILSPELRAGQYPHQLSGGLRQRVAIAIALSCGPKLIIADEPTTALDATVQAGILDLLGRIQEERQMGMILISHDLGVVAGRTHETAVMHAGKIVEHAPTDELFRHMQTPYTRSLMAAVPRISDPPHTKLQTMSGQQPVKPKALLVTRMLTIAYRIGFKTEIQAVSKVSFEINAGETLGLVGESGCGKSSVARAIIRLLTPISGRICYDGEDLLKCTSRRLKEIRPGIQMIFQDAVASLNPGRKIGRAIEEPLRVLGKADRHERERRARLMMKAVGLDPDLLYDRNPHELSVGQCQRVSIARALITRPRLLICDEPVSSLDVSIQAKILRLLEEMKKRFDLTMLFISHDLAVVKHISDRVAVMREGALCEIADAEALYRSPTHPYSKMLIASMPDEFLVSMGIV